ncbi:MAG: hypothetical protein ACRD19_14895 [Terriglobia bacterium]
MMTIDAGGRRVRITAALALAVVIADCARGPGTHMVVLLSRVWLIGMQGQIAPFPYRVANGYMEGVQGWTPPLPSPDGRWITFGNDAEDYDVHLLDVHQIRERRITWLGRRPAIGYTFAATRVAGWSANSRQIFLSVTPGEVDSDEGQYNVPKTAYGFYIYDLASGRVSPVALPKAFDFAVWLPDGRFLGTVPGSTPCENKLVAFSPGSMRGTAVGPQFTNAVQVKASADYRWVVGVFGIKGCGDSEMDEIAKIDLRTGRATALVPPASWAVNQRPELSPDGQHVSYIHQRRMLKGVPQESLFVDSRSIYACPGSIDYQRVGSRRIALACVTSSYPLKGKVVTLDASTGKTLASRSL